MKKDPRKNPGIYSFTGKVSTLLRIARENKRRLKAIGMC
jgi:hypothetical protein